MPTTNNVFTTYLGENVNSLLKQKVAQNVAFLLATSYFQKNHNKIPKIAQLEKIANPVHSVHSTLTQSS
jgi:hypothetical protein